MQVYSYFLNVKGAEKPIKVCQQGPVLNPRAVYTVIVKDKVTLDRTSLQVLQVPLLIIMPPMLHSLIYHSCLVQRVQLRSKYQWTQSHETARVKKNPRFFMETEDSSPFSRQPASGHYSQLDGSRFIFIPHFF
jgi:hypothetical protein